MACASDFCPAGVPGPLAAWPWSPVTPHLKMESSMVELDTALGSRIWSVPIRSTQEPDLVARGDFTGDGVADYVFDEVRPASPARMCGTHEMSESDLLFVDGATGTSWRPVEPTLDVCWPALGYATHQWGVGTAYLGRLQPGVAADEAVLFPYYSTAGWVLRYSPQSGWRRVDGATPELVYPSTPAYDQVYDAANSTPCSSPTGFGRCYVDDSHVPNGVFIGGDGDRAGLFVLTSDRALIYRSDFTPTSDYAWSYAEGSGRNYGLVESHDIGGADIVTLVGGCSVAKTRDTMRTGQLSNDPCALQHHYEFFRLQGTSILEHSGRFFGWAGSEGLWQDRLEFPFPSMVPVTGGSLWSVFNLYRDGQWRMELLPDPDQPNSGLEFAGWYVWGAVTSRSGETFLAATRAGSTTTTDVASYVPPWQFDLLALRGGSLLVVAHHEGVVPSLALVPPGPSYHASDGDPFGLMVSESDACGPFQLMVETRDSIPSSVPIPDRLGGAC